jgi:hypothetical protein
MNTTRNAAICHWLTPTRIMPHPRSFEAATHCWTCLRDDDPRALDQNELNRCATCARREARTFESEMRDLVFETWGVGIPLPNDRTFEHARRDLVLDAWGVE